MVTIGKIFMTFWLLIISSLAFSAGGIPLQGLSYARPVEKKARQLILSNRTLRERFKATIPAGLHSQEIEQLIESQRDLRDNDVSTDEEKQLLSETLKDMPWDVPYDPEYVAILEEIDRKHSLYKLSHRDVQWKVVAQVMRTLSNEDRVELIRNVRRYPLHRQLPPTAAITSRELGHWQIARSQFLNTIKEVD